MAQFAFCVAQETPDPLTGMFRKRKGPKCQISSFSGINSRTIPATESDERGGGTGEPFVVAESRKADERTAEQADDASSDEAHEE